jgi:hypothetical protein
VLRPRLGITILFVSKSFEVPKEEPVRRTTQPLLRSGADSCPLSLRGRSIDEKMSLRA